jgi:hypothetical protein
MLVQRNKRKITTAGDERTSTYTSAHMKKTMRVDGAVISRTMPCTTVQHAAAQRAGRTANKIHDSINGRDLDCFDCSLNVLKDRNVHRATSDTLVHGTCVVLQYKGHASVSRTIQNNNAEQI